MNYKNKQDNRRSHFSPLCALITPSRPIPFAANAAATEWSLLLHDVIGDWMILFAVNALQCIVSGEENPQNCPFPWDFVTLPEEDRAMAISNMHRKNGKDRACGSGDILADRQTDRQTCSSQYFATAPATSSCYWTTAADFAKPSLLCCQYYWYSYRLETSTWRPHSRSHHHLNTESSTNRKTCNCYLFTVSNSGLLLADRARLVTCMRGRKCVSSYMNSASWDRELWLATLTF